MRGCKQEFCAQCRPVTGQMNQWRVGREKSYNRIDRCMQGTHLLECFSHQRPHSYTFQIQPKAVLRQAALLEEQKCNLGKNKKSGRATWLSQNPACLLILCDAPQECIFSESNMGALKEEGTRSGIDFSLKRNLLYQPSALYQMLKVDCQTYSKSLRELHKRDGSFHR